VPISAIISINVRIPGAEMPSSLVTRIKGLACFIEEVFKLVLLNFK